MAASFCFSCFLNARVKISNHFPKPQFLLNIIIIIMVKMFVFKIHAILLSEKSNYFTNFVFFLPCIFIYLFMIIFIL